MQKRKKFLEKENINIGQKEQEMEAEAEMLRLQIESSNPGQLREKERERREKIKDLETKEAKAQQRLEEQQGELVSREVEQQEEERKRKELEFEHKREEVALSGLEKEKSNLEKLGNKKLASIDHRAPTMADEIEKAMKSKLFKVRPIGPVGSLIELSGEADGNPELVKLLEAELGSKLLKSYLCNDDQDRKVLWEIIHQVYGSQSVRKPTVFTTKFLKSRHNVPRVEGGHRTVMDYLELSGSEEDQAVVFNHLVDLKKIEAVVVKRSQTEAGSLCTMRQNVPANLESCITWDLYRYFPPTSTSSYRSYYILPATSKILGSSLGSKISQQNQMIEESKEKIHKMRLESDKKKKAIQVLEKVIKDMKSAMAMLAKNLSDYTNYKSRLLVQDPREELNTREKSLELKMEELRKLKEEKSKKLKQKEALIKEESIKTDELKKNFANAKKSREEIAPIKAKIDQVQRDIKVKTYDKMNQEKLMRKYVKDRDELSNKLESELKTEQKARRKSKDLGGGEAEMQSPRSRQEIQAKIKLLAEKNIPDGVNEASLLQENSDLKKKYEEQKKDLENFKNLLDQLGEMNQRRVENFQTLRSCITKIIRRQFYQMSREMSQVHY